MTYDACNYQNGLTLGLGFISLPALTTSHLIMFQRILKAKQKPSIGQANEKYTKH
jgi:hypothetical protein